MMVTDTTALRYAQQDPDVRLMLQVRDDNATAFEELVLRYQARLISVLEHVVGRRGQAEDLAQEVFLRVFRARKGYQPGAKFSTWLFTIANNLASNSQRSRSRRKEVNIASGSSTTSLQPLEGMAIAESSLMPTRQVDASERGTVVRAAIQSLSDRQRMALLLCKFEEMSYVEIAETMELTVPAVKSLLSRARVNLKDALEPYMQDGVLPESDVDELGGVGPDE